MKAVMHCGWERSSLLFRDMSENAAANEVDRINELADELNDEARDVLEFQIFW